MGMIAGASMTKPGFTQSALWLIGCVLLIGVLMLPFAIGKAGTASPVGILVAGAFCLVASLTSDAVGSFFARSGSALGALVVGMGVRMTLPLALCLLLAARGDSGRQHLALVCYLLVFYLATLAVETCLSVRRLSTRSFCPTNSR
jgi:hypothetical protein